MLSRLMTVREQIILAAIAGAIVLGSVTLYLKDNRDVTPEEAPIPEVETPVATTLPEETPTPSTQSPTPPSTPPDLARSRAYGK